MATQRKSNLSFRIRMVGHEIKDKADDICTVKPIKRSPYGQRESGHLRKETS